MMTSVAGAVIGVALLGYILAKLGRAVRARWFLVRLWRWLSGEAHHGHPVTDAGWFRAGQRALTPTGHATRWWHLPRWKRAAHRSGGTLAVVAVAAAFLVNTLITGLVIVCLMFVSAGLGTWLLTRRVMGRKQQREWLLPLHLAAHELAGIPRASRASSWITAELDDAGAVRKATLELPQGWPADSKDEQRLIAVASAKLAIENPEPSWRRAGPTPLLTLTHSEPPPTLVKWEDVAAAVDRAHANEIIAGVGKKGVIPKASLSLDSPHFGINMGSGAGKSTLAAFWLMQELRRGAIAMVLDAKWFSHPWCIKDEDGEYSQLPNVAYLSSEAELHAGMVWLGGELKRRTKVAQRAVTASGHLRGDVGPRLIVVAEELNLAMPQVKQYWSDIREPSDVKRSPALAGLAAVAFAGRALKMHLLLIGQMLTADVTGGKDSSVKQNVGVWAMSRYGAQGWRTAVGDVPMPPPPSWPGRIQLVMARGVQEVQTPLVDGNLIRELVMAGKVTPCPAGMPGAVTVTAHDELQGGPDLPVETVSAAALPAGNGHLVSLREAVDRGVVHQGTTLAALRMARFRSRHGDATFPEARGRRRTEDLFEARDLADWDAGRR